MIDSIKVLMVMGGVEDERSKYTICFFELVGRTK